MKIYFTEKNVSSDLEAIEVAGSVLVQEGRVMPGLLLHVQIEKKFILRD